MRRASAKPAAIGDAAAKTRYARGVGSAAGGLGVLLLLLSLAGTARADDRLVLEWRAPDGCPTRDAVEGEVARLVGGELPEGATIRADAQTIPAEGAFELTLRTDVEGELGARTLRAERCDELAAAAALILALMIDPEAAMRAEPEHEPSAPAPGPSLADALGPPTRVIEPPRATEVRRADARRMAEPFTSAGPPPAVRGDSIEALLGAGIALDVAALPSATAALVVEGGLGVPLIDARLRATLLFPQTVASGELSGASAELMGFTAGVIACLRPIEQARAFGICADVAAGSVFGSARGISDPGSGAGFWLAAGGGLALAWQPAPWFDLEGMAELLGQYAQTFDIVVGGGSVVVFAPPPVTGRLTLAAHVHF